VNSALNFYEIGDSTKKYDPINFAETMSKENETFNFMSKYVKASNRITCFSIFILNVFG